LIQPRTGVGKSDVPKGGADHPELARDGRSSHGAGLEGREFENEKDMRGVLMLKMLIPMEAYRYA
jgi:hypothetical protein